MKAKTTLILIFLGVSFVSIGWQQPIKHNTDGYVHQVEKATWVDSVANSLTTDEKIAQFFMPAIYSNRTDAHKEELLSLVKKYNIGGVCFFQGTASKQAEWANELQAVAKTPLFVSIDGEWGVSMRLQNTVKYPRQLTLGAIKDEGLIFKMGQRIADECKAVGVNINFAPVLDVNNNPNNPVINDRSFGEDKMNVAIKGMAYFEGMQSKGIMAVGKHFPGHGDTDSDSHLTLPVINHDITRLRNLEMYPFQVAFENNLMGVMAAHLFIPALDNTPNLATSLSPKVTTHYLRDTLGFNGLVFSDALNMKGVSDYYDKGVLDKVAFLAGNDVLVFSEDIPKGISLIRSALDNGEITEEYLNQRLKKVLEHKYDLGLHKKDTTSLMGIDTYLNNAEAQQLQKDLYANAITLVNNNDQLFPFNAQNKKTAVLALGKSGATDFQSYIANAQMITSYAAANDLTEVQAKAFATTLGAYDQVLIAVYNMSRYNSKNYGFSAAELNLLKSLNAKTKVGVVLFGSPYSLKHFDGFNNIIVAYEENQITELVAANAVLGNAKIDGMLPVSAGKYTYGQGITMLPNSTLSYGIPEEVFPNPLYLRNIENIARKAIDIKATPGCQILVAKDGKIVYEQAFGHQTYNHQKPINNTNIYDLASITKVAATTISVMKLYEADLIDLEKPLKDYLFGYDSSAVGNLIIKDILAHQSGLPAWIPFYSYTLADSIFYDWYQADSSASFCVPVAKDLFICQDSTEVIWKTISGVKIKTDPDYRYSDIGFYLLKSLVEQVSGLPFEDYVEMQFYEPMGLQRTSFLPLKKYPLESIVPTEEDKIFRKQVVQGFVHDPGAAMLGGVSGHAGLFSNAHDLAAIMQLLLNGGVYNNKQFLTQETIDYFTSPVFIHKDNRRGLGFDKPVLKNENGIREGGPTCPEVSDFTFGHTGFTGTAAWADPEHNLVYIFLSNRVYPDASNNILAKENIRTDIQSEIYKALGIFEGE